MSDNKLERLREFIASLDKPCDECLGIGYDSGHSCRQCRGSGYMLTDAGELVMEFVNRHLTANYSGCD